jgi:hypothetical protein
MLSQDDYNDYIEFQNFKKLKYAQQQQFKNALPQLGNLSPAAFNHLFNNANVGTSLSSIFPMTSTASPSTTNAAILANNANFYAQQQSNQIIPKVLPPGMPGMQQLMRPQHPQHPFLQYKNIPANFPGLKGGASNYSQPPQQLFMSPPAMPIQSLTSKVATPRQQLMSPTTPNQPQHQQQQQQLISPPRQQSTPTPKRSHAPPSPEIIVDDRPEQQASPEKKPRIEQPYTIESNSFLPKLPLQSSIEKPTTLPSTLSSTISSITSPTSSSSISLPSTVKTFSSPTEGSSSVHQPFHHQHRLSDSMEGEETHIIITARPRVPNSSERDEAYTTEEDSDYDTNLRPKETPLQYKERMMERVMDKAKRKNEASKRSREKRKREHHDRQIEKQRLEKRNTELTEKLMNLKEALKRLRPQICSSCNEQVQKFLDQCQNSREGMNVFVLRPCKQEKCPGNKSVGREINKFARS